MRTVAAIAALALLGGCGDSAREVDYTPQRGISADIDAARLAGPTALRPGMAARGEPLGAFPWRLDERHQE
jgi:hypothetical protein